MIINAIKLWATVFSFMITVATILIVQQNQFLQHLGVYIYISTLVIFLFENSIHEWITTTD